MGIFSVFVVLHRFWKGILKVSVAFSLILPVVS